MAPLFYYLTTLQVPLSMLFALSVSSPVANEEGSYSSMSSSWSSSMLPSSTAVPAPASSSSSCSLDKRQTIDDIWECAGGNLESAFYDPTHIERTLIQGYTLLVEGRQIQSVDGRNRFYPNAFHNALEQNRFPIITANCGVESPTNPLSEYPILEYTTFAALRRAKQDRIVFDGCGRFCGLVTHRGEQGNRLHECEAL